MSIPLQYTREDDFVECFLFPHLCYKSTEEISQDELVSEINKYNNHISMYTREYIWHRDSLGFQARTKNIIQLNKELDGGARVEDYQLPPHVYASLRFDEDVGDEWFLVFLVVELTKAFDGLIVKLVDSDGEFLLIEAAEALPSWATPQTCQDRVFIYNGEIHVVRDENLSHIEMLRTINEKPTASKMECGVQAAIQKRISIYPMEIQNRIHKARVFLPERAIAILRQEPGLIAAALRTVCQSDPLERKVCQAMKYFPPEQRAMVNVKMTRCLYAMAIHCRYAGDPRTGWNLPSPNDSQHKPHLLGIKISCGLEMLVARASRKIKQNKESESKNETEWVAYLKRLTANGYFRNLLEGSQEYNRLLRLAKEYFQSSSRDHSLSGDKNEARRILEAWRNAPCYELESLSEGRLSPPDNDNWLNIDPEQLHSMLDQQWSSNDRMVDQHPPSIQEKVREFLQHSSDVDGVQFPSQLTKSNADNNEIRVNGDADDTRIDFNADAFDSALRGILDLVVPGDENDFDSNSEGSLGGSEEDKGGELDKYMRLLDSQLEMDLHLSGLRENANADTCVEDSTVEMNLRESAEGEAGGTGAVGNILGGPIRRLLHLHLQSPSTVPPDLQS
ncbi:protein ecdysoneless [Diprion similis]|uniref:protein ecdysoneless n=1 Tax=Diprion similis TaxID=362088 RepID=UPI001EF94923|nr:protein ecdysoneless [Diprion similis]